LHYGLCHDLNSPRWSCRAPAKTLRRRTLPIQTARLKRTRRAPTGFRTLLRILRAVRGADRLRRFFWYNRANPDAPDDSQLL
jgi:hypothetical protein